MKVLGRRVLVEQVMVEKKSSIIIPESQKKTGKPEDNYEVTFSIIQIGNDVPEGLIEVGDKPIFGKYVDFNGVKVIEKSKEKEVLHVIVGFDDIIGIDD